MKKKTLLLILFIGVLFSLTGCLGKEEKSAGLKFKEDYEEINGKVNKKGKTNRTVEISGNNVFVETTPEEIVKMIENKETFYVYFGSRLCPWCRSVIEKADEISRINDIEKIYYVDIWDDEGNEIFRDKYELDENNQPVKVFDGTEEYKFLINKFDSFLRDYTISDSNKNDIPVGEKRIYAPNFVYISKGEIKRLVTGKSKLQKEAFDELTKEILEDELDTFNNFFINICDDAC